MKNISIPPLVTPVKGNLSDLPVRNGARSLARAVRSILSQTSASLELLVVDDGSTDGTAELISQFVAQDTRVKPLSTAAGRGGTAGRARNVALSCATGRWLTCPQLLGQWAKLIH